MPSTPDNSLAHPRVLVVDDDRTQADLLCSMLELEGFEAEAAYGPREGLASLRRKRAHAIISDYNMPVMNGVEFFREARVVTPDVAFIIITAFGTVETAVEAMKQGVQDFVTKPVDVSELTVKIRKALRIRDLESENRSLRGEVAVLRERVRVIGNSAAMHQILERVGQVAQSPATVLIQGESGTGKELIARAIHLQSPRHTGPYVTVNCAAIPENLLESELFGHLRGAFTGAVGDRKGRFEMANGGTMLLDEVGDLPLFLQPKLLRVLQEKEVEPLGGHGPVSINVRLIAATHCDLRSMVREGTFREDLFYRLNVIPLHLPPLRERPEDIMPLAEHFLARFAHDNLRRLKGFTREAEERLRTWSWPGNVRELENCIERAVVLSATDTVEEADLMLEIGSPMRGAGVDAVLEALFDSTMTLDELERDIILASLRRCGGNLSRTARTLGLTRRALQYRVEKIRTEEDREEDGDGEGGGKPGA
jgi:DNA-binding NtrC family response regulator